MSVIEMIIQKINKALVIEDDLDRGFHRLRGIKLDELHKDSIIYFGEHYILLSKIILSYKNTIQSFKQGINVIDSKNIEYGRGTIYYFPT